MLFLPPNWYHIFGNFCVSGSLTLLFEPFSTDFIFLALRISYKGESLIKKFKHLIFWLCYLDLQLSCRSHPFCLQYFIQERVTNQEVHASNSLALLFRPLTTLQISSFLSSEFYAGENHLLRGFCIWFYGYVTRLDLGLLYRLDLDYFASFIFFFLVSHTEENYTY